MGNNASASLMVRGYDGLMTAPRHAFTRSSVSQACASRYPALPGAAYL